MAIKLKSTKDTSTLLNTPLCSLHLQKSEGIVFECIQQVRDELNAKGIKFNFHYWVSDDWFCPDGIAGIAIPFYLLNSEISTIVKDFIGDIEGQTRSECLKLIRHEVGHAIDNAYNIRECKSRINLFGDSKTKYPKEYIRKPFSRNYVKHIKENYAQAHPDEDWAETFAVWLNPTSNWKEKYKNWPALKKLDYVEMVMRDLSKRKLALKNRDTIDEISTIGITLKTYLNRKFKQKNKYKSPLFGRELNKVFHLGSKRSALSFINNNEKELCIRVAKNTKQYHYIVKDVLKELKIECREKSLTLKMPAGKTRATLVDLLNKSTIQYIEQGKNKVIM